MVLREHFKSLPFFFKRNAFGIMGGSVAIVSDRKHESHFSRPVARCSGSLAIGSACSFSAFGTSLHANRDASGKCNSWLVAGHVGRNWPSTLISRQRHLYDKSTKDKSANDTSAKPTVRMPTVRKGQQCE